jgi:DNA-binding transcriptional LysR family regulator
MVNITLSRLRVFLAVAELESISAASERLAVSQPAVSATVAALAKEIGAPLIERDGRRIRLTAGGRRLERHARRFLSLLEDAVDEVRALGAQEHPRVRVVAVNTAAEHILPPLLGAVREAYPGLDMQLDVIARQEVWKRLAAYEAHVAIAGRPPLDQHFRTVATRRNAIVVIAPPATRIAVEALADATWIVREPGSGTHALSEEFFEALGIAPQHRLTISSNGAIRECVRVGLGLSLVSRDAARRELETGSLAEVATPLTPFERAWHVVVNADYRLPEGAERFLQAFLTAANDLDDGWSLA